ncbi:hypothetical protein E2562_024287 [Oryza meyeriana var. granulata]|uniref:WRKY domain-containing protein n=1 Tax=Oryza meyeriana var. granulata TaxID=110450 RepID=A0A6G1C880_9ORYZ|nr:hypothetical protein E2562_024287 [Oryza meyeriana var. granulata]
MLNLPGRLEELLLRHGSMLPKGADEEIPLIKRDLDEIISILHGHSEPKLEDHAMVVRCWMKEVRELSYDIEDCIDQYEHTAGSRSGPNICRRKFSRRRGNKIPWVPQKLKQRLWMANKIREFSLRTQEALQRHAMYNNLGGIASTSSTTRGDRSSSGMACHHRPGKEEQEASELPTELRRGQWTVDEDLTLINYISDHGEGHWNSVASGTGTYWNWVARATGLKRTGKSCRLRWLNYLRPDVKRGNFTAEEQLLILDLHSRWGNRWSRIAQHLPGRTDNEIKNYWRTRVQKHRKISMEGAMLTSMPDVVGIDATMNKIKNWLALCDGEEKLRVVSIVGVGGIGKTTLTNKLYRKLRWQFECRAFVRISQKTNIRRLLINILSQIGIGKVTCDDVDVLGGLLALTVLSLYVDMKPAERIVFVGFPILKYFKFRCSVVWMKFEAGAMPNLRKLKLGFDVHRTYQHDGRPSVNILYIDWRFGSYVGFYTFDGEDDDNVGTQEEEHRTLQKQHHIVKEELNEKSAVLRKDPRETHESVDNSIDWMFGSCVRFYTFDGLNEKSAVLRKDPRETHESVDNRSYFRCTHRQTKGCPARKQVQPTNGDPMILDVIYYGEHSCDHSAHSDVRPATPKVRKTMRRRSTQVRTSPVLHVNPVDDGYSWRKYGQKDILGTKYPRAYFRCAHRNTKGCMATKQIQRTDGDPLLFDVLYHGDHICDQIQMGRLNEQVRWSPSSASRPEQSSDLEQSSTITGKACSVDEQDVTLPANFLSMDDMLDLSNGGVIDEDFLSFGFDAIYASDTSSI